MEVFNSFLLFISNVVTWLTLAFFFGRKINQHKKNLIVDDKALAYLVYVEVA